MLGRTVLLLVVVMLAVNLPGVSMHRPIDTGEPCTYGIYACRRTCFIKYRLYQGDCSTGRCECFAYLPY
ncbi:hypothetical protein V3C99_002882 [Haemonchus contortus]